MVLESWIWIHVSGGDFECFHHGTSRISLVISVYIHQLCQPVVQQLFAQMPPRHSQASVHHTASQTDGKTHISTCGEVTMTVTKGDCVLTVQAVVVDSLDCDILGGVPFLKSNNIILDLPQESIVINGKSFRYKSPNAPRATPPSQSYVLRVSRSQTVYPGEYVECRSPLPTLRDGPVAIEPRFDSDSIHWVEPQITRSVSGIIRIPNTTNEPVIITKHQYLAQIHYAVLCSDLESLSRDDVQTHRVCHGTTSPHSSPISIDSDSQLPESVCSAFKNLHNRYDRVFDSKIGLYNDASGPVRAFINMGPTDPPAQKARLPSYSTDKLNLLQDKMDELEQLGVLARPEDLGVKIEHVSPSFLVKKPDGTHRLVTAFNNIASYSKSIPSKPSSTDDIVLLRFLAGFNFIIKTDMTKQFFQLAMKKSSLKYLGVLTPYKGMRVYTRAAMGMPGSSEHLDELMSRVLGHLAQDGILRRIADDLYIGGNTPEELLVNWERVLQQFEKNNLRLSASKTVICPINTTILGWIWSSGNITASAHKVTPLATWSLPSTVKELRSWIGAFKHLKVCVPHYSALLSDLESASGGKESKMKMQWTDELISCFKAAQSALADIQSITIPRPSDQLVITSDGALKNGGIGAVLYISRGQKMLVGGFFSAKLRSHQQKWLPCEVEALAISSSLSYWSPYILNSLHPVQVLTDSRPCVQAYNKLVRGHFSSSARVSTFLSI